MFRKLIAVLIIASVGVIASSSTVWAQPGQPAAEPAAAAAPTEAPPAGEPVPEAAPSAPVEAVEASTGDKPAPSEASDPKKSESKAGEAKAVEKVWEFTDNEPLGMLPVKATGNTEHVDWMFNAILGLSIFCFLAITIAVVYLTWRFRHRPGHKTAPSRSHDNALEIVWTVIPSIICVLIFIGGWKGYLQMTTAPADAMEINVVGQKWVWGFTYSHGQETVQRAELHVPVNRPVKLVMRSEDVLHSFYVPAFRTKQDVIPSRYSYVWFEANTPGVYRAYCAEYCGDAHSDMKTKVIVHEPGGYKAWLNEEYEKDQVDCREFEGQERQDCYMSQGEKIYINKGCKQCHSLDGSAGTGPTFQKIWGQTRNFTDGTSGTVDENYVRESVLDPMAKVRSGFNPVMPTFKGKLKDKDIDALNNWMKAL